MTHSRHERGQTAEAAVAAALVADGFSIVARNLRLGRLELDIVARQGALIVVVEVRSRGPGARTTGFGSISASKRDRLRRAARRLWRDRYVADPSVQRLRLDAASVTFEGEQAQIIYCAGAITFDALAP
jgi:putative endonuclease